MKKKYNDEATKWGQTILGNVIIEPFIRDILIFAKTKYCLLGWISDSISRVGTYVEILNSSQTTVGEMDTNLVYQMCKVYNQSIVLRRNNSISNNYTASTK